MLRPRLSRRDVLRLLALGVPAGAIAACGVETPSAAAPASSGTGDDAGVASTPATLRSADVLVLGAGIAGLRAAEPAW